MKKDRKPVASAAGEKYKEKSGEATSDLEAKNVHGAKKKLPNNEGESAAGGSGGPVAEGVPARNNNDATTDATIKDYMWMAFTKLVKILFHWFLMYILGQIISLVPWTRYSARIHHSYKAHLTLQMIAGA